MLIEHSTDITNNNHTIVHDLIIEELEQHEKMGLLNPLKFNLHVYMNSRIFNQPDNDAIGFFLALLHIRKSHEEGWSNQCHFKVSITITH